MMQDRLGLNLNKKDRFALAEKFCYIFGAPAKSGVGIRSPHNNHRHLTFVRYGELLRAALAGRYCGCGTSNPLWLATIRFEAGVGGVSKLTAGNTMNNLWCSLLHDVCCQIFISFQGPILAKGAMT